MQAVIMAGGRGTRLSKIVKEIPKPMFPVCGKPVLEHQIIMLKKFGIIDIKLIIGHLGYAIKDYFKDGKHLGVNISYYEESIPLGTAGALSCIKNELEEDFLLLFGDVFLDIDITGFIKFHIDKKSKITLFVHPNSHPYDSDIVVCNTDGRVIHWDSKHNVRNYDYKNLVNAGLYIMSKKEFDHILDYGKKDLERDIIIPAVAKGEEVFAYHSTEYVKDMGTPDRYKRVEEDVLSDIPAMKNKKEKQKCIFLDRDGTINEYVGFLTKPEQLKLIPATGEAIRLINNSSYLCIVVTNQPVIARGECTFAGLDQIHNRLETLLGKEHAYIDDLFFCPHHPHKGYKDEITELKIDCECRKPKIKMFQDAAQRYNIDLEESYIIGDSSADMEAGKRAGMHSILVKTGEAGEDRKFDARPDYVAANLLDAVKIALKG